MLSFARSRPLVIAAGLCFLCTSAAEGQVQTQTLPAGFESVTGGFQVVDPFVNSPPTRVHWVYDSRQFVEPGPIRIRGIALRPAPIVQLWGPVVYRDLTLSMALSANDYGASYVSLFEDNFLTVPETQFAGDLSIPFGSNPGGFPPWAVEIGSAAGFIYDPTQQKDLILEWKLPGGPGGTNPALFQVDGRAGSAGAIGGNLYSHRSNAFSPHYHFELVGDLAPIIRIDYEPFVGTHPAFGATPTRGVAPLTVNFREHVITSAPTGVQAYSWDFQNDGITDSNAANPSFTYSQPGIYSVRFAARGLNGVIGSLVHTALIEVLAPTSNTTSPGILELHFDEVRGTRVANTASTTAAPSFGTVTAPGWQRAALRAGFQGNEPGFGCLGSDPAAPTDPFVSFDWNLEHRGSCTIAWWQRMRAAPGAVEVDVVNAGPGFRIFTGGAAGNSISVRGTLFGSFTSTGSVQTNPDVWTHVALVIDDEQGLARWFLNGVQDAARSFQIGTFRLGAPSPLRIGSNGVAPAYTRFYDIDDFRFYDGLFAPRIFLGPFSAESAANAPYDSGCAASGSSPTIDGNSAPELGNATYAITLAGAAPGSAASLVMGFTTHVFGLWPLDLGSIVGPGCRLGPFPDFSFGAFAASGSVEFAVPIPADPLLSGAHSYAQWIVLGSNPAMSTALDINLR